MEVSKAAREGTSRAALPTSILIAYSRKMPEFIGIANHPYIYNVLLLNRHRQNRKRMTIHAQQERWLPIDLPELDGGPLRQKAQ